MAGIPTWVPGEVLASADVNNWFVPLAAVRTADATPVLNTTMTNDDTLFWPVAANATYVFFLYLIYTGSATGGFKFQLTAPSGASAKFTGTWNVAGGGAFPTALGALSTPQTVTIGTLNAEYDSFWQGTLVTSSTTGNFQLQWAEQATDAVHGSYVWAKSALWAQRIS